MSKTRLFLFVTLFAALAVAGCTRSASTSPVENATQDPIESIFSTVATQTALAAQGGGEDDEGDVPTELPATDTPEVSPTPEPTASNTPVPTSELGVPSTYTLHEGEWPYCLARRFDIDPDALLAANNLSSPTELSVGTVISIPTTAGPFGGQRALRSHPTTYTASGVDTFYSIACQFGDVWPEHIAEANGQPIDYEPAAGEQLFIP